MGKNKKNKKCKSWQSKSQINKASWGLFYRRGWRRFLKIKDIPIYFKRIFFVIKHGYYPPAKWETSNYFIDMFREIFTWYRYNRSSSPMMVDMDNYNFDANTKAADDLYDTLIDLLDKMDERNPIYDETSFEDQGIAMTKAKNEFFELFSRHFYDFWD